jgi:N-formylglutamate amidohydrolase
VDSQDFFDDPAPAFAEVERFLGLPSASGIEFERHNARPRSPMPDELRARLDEHYRPYDERLAAWWGRTPSWRR